MKCPFRKFKQSIIDAGCSNYMARISTQLGIEFSYHSGELIIK